MQHFLFCLVFEPHFYRNVGIAVDTATCVEQQGRQRNTTVLKRISFYFLSGRQLTAEME